MVGHGDGVANSILGSRLSQKFGFGDNVPSMDGTSAVPAGSRSPNYGSTAACSPAVREELPDLTEHLKANGIYEETRGLLQGAEGRPMALMTP